MNTCCVSFFFVLIKPLSVIVLLVLSATNHLSPISLPHQFLFSPSSLLHPSPTLFLPCSLSRNCKLQIRNIPPHMQWEVSANRLLTASRAGHHRAAQPGSHLVASGVTLAPFGSQLSASFMSRLNGDMSLTGVVRRPL